MIIITQKKPTLKPNLTIACFNPPPTNWQNSRNFLVLYSPLCSTIVPYVLKWSCTVPYGPVWSPMVSYCPLWSHMVPVWFCMVLYGPVCSGMFMNRPVWSCMYPYDLLWYCMVLEMLSSPIAPLSPVRCQNLANIESFAFLFNLCLINQFELCLDLNFLFASLCFVIFLDEESNIIKCLSIKNPSIEGMTLLFFEKYFLIKTSIISFPPADFLRLRAIAFVNLSARELVRKFSIAVLLSAIIKMKNPCMSRSSRCFLRNSVACSGPPTSRMYAFFWWNKVFDKLFFCLSDDLVFYCCLSHDWRKHYLPLFL